MRGSPRLCSLMFTLLLLYGVGACAAQTADNSGPSGALGADARQQRAFAAAAVVGVHELGDVLRSAGGGVAILDVRPAEVYEAGHLPGAVRVDYATWERLSKSPQSGLSHERAWHERIGALGIDGDDLVVVYDGGRMTRAARVWFILQHFGVARAMVVNGGYPLIASAADAGELTLESGGLVPKPARFEPRSDRAGRIGVVTRERVREAIAAGRSQVLDVRTRDEYLGLDLRDNARGGHLPGAVSLPHASLLDSRGRLREAEELERLFEQAGVERDQPIITHCDGGGRAALAALAAARAGYGPVVNYYLSFGDWAKDATCPVVTPQ